MKTTKARKAKRGSGSLERLVRRWMRASRLYNLDCNTRLPKPGDAKNNELMWKSHNTFEAMMKALKEELNIS